ncbi:MAG: ATP-binding cassette domain-containing protein [Verrucomicrobiaceae bacterium]|nr:MAG: ATP-binding cassette domain-containing protein [Verrucomicrobiaceae bacterium]
MNPGPGTVAGIGPLPLRDGWVFGRGETASTILPDPSVSRRHAVISGSPGKWVIEDAGSRSGSYLNGRLFQREELVLGDILKIGPFGFRFDGLRFVGTFGTTGAVLEAWELSKTAGGTKILDAVTLRIEACQFVGVIGPSGAGKSTLLDALCALRPADSGQVTVDGVDIYRHYEFLRDSLGYVPQDDIVPLELPVEEALYYSARLRFPAETPLAEIRKVVARTISQLGLTERAGTRVGSLSGGQRKRVSVGAELLGRPRLLFLDEPTSGLDPSAEFKLMESLRLLAAGGCTVICTTHVMENVHLMDRLAVLSEGRLVFFDEPGSARGAFGIERMTQLYERIPHAPRLPDAAGAPPKPREPEQHPSPRRAPALRILLLRQWAILRADWKNLLLVLGQPALIGLMVTWVTRDPALILFFAMISTLWFGCGNAAQEIVKELPMFRRERLIGLGRHEYLLSKFLTLSRITVVQSLLLYGVMQLCASGIGGSPGWQIGALVATSLASVGLGLAISALSRTILQAVMLVPLVLIPQILFSGFTPPAGDMKPGPYFVSRLMPSASTQAVMDTSLFWGKKITGSMRVDFPTAFSNLNHDKSLRNGQIYQNPRPAVEGLAALLAWTISTYVAAWFGIRGKERG